jgi:hypothetical protein
MQMYIGMLDTCHPLMLKVAIELAAYSLFQVAEAKYKQPEESSTVV